MKKVLLVYYTGTYNTRYLSNKIKDRFISIGYEVDMIEINSDSVIKSTLEYDIIGFGYPIYGFNSPLPFNKFVKLLTFKENQKYFIYKNSGETFAMNNPSSRILIRHMNKFKASLIGEYHYVMPYNIHFRFDDAFVKEILEKNNKLMDVMFYNFKNNIVFKIKSNFVYDTAAFFVGIQKIGGNVNSFLYKVDQNKCINCNKCVNTCPHNNIYVKDGKIKFHHHCDMCMRCSFFCPTDAIKIGFLQGWKVNGAYNFNKIENDKTLKTPYITKDAKGFYKCFIKHFEFIDKEYDKIAKNAE